MKVNKTNVARLLDKAKVAYELIPYEVDENDLSAVHVAASLGEDIDCVFKTLVLHGDKSGYFASAHGLYPWGMFAYRDEETFPYLYPQDLLGFSFYLC